ncbi:DUF2309 domain-containing protein [Gemmata sp. G18]|uniref:Probable inorganic carbon transporter subunit DabA n=1 Tax=Gemmata palustris TaxID=2822762 RepID=A0ABS5BPY8_9BACT|nr:DUF2309 domain-containing protein [Gemmata palustris]MBP3955794.1 DUF2309 domain-containing protein [Gemmata palustris]
MAAKNPAHSDLPSSHGPGSDPPTDRLRQTIDHAAHLLPAQGPISVFIHHNTLHAFEHMPFLEAVEHGAKLFGCEPYMTEDRYRDALVRGRIRFEDLRAVLASDLGTRAAEPFPPYGTKLDLRLALLQYPLQDVRNEAELQWFIEETDALRRVRPEASAAARSKLIGETRRWAMRDLRGNNSAERPAWLVRVLEEFGGDGVDMLPEEVWEACALESLWHSCLEGVRGVPQTASAPPVPVRHRDLLLAVAGADTDIPVNELLTRFCAAFLDQGVAHWPLPNREEGFFRTFGALYRESSRVPNRWLRGLDTELARLLDGNVAPLESACASLTALGVPETEWDAYTAAMLLSLRGWGGMIHQTEERRDRLPTPPKAGSLHEFVAVRLLLERLAVENAAREALDYTGPLTELRAHLRARLKPWVPPTPQMRAFPIFQLAQVLGWSPDELAAWLTPAAWDTLVREVEGFSDVPRRRVFHLAYEARFRAQVLDALALHAPKKPHAARFQIVTCLDEREESFRRHLEEVAPECETFGAAGFFALPMYYKGANDAHFIPLCPIVMTPKHWVAERPDESLEHAHNRVRRTHRVLGRAAHQAHIGSRSLALGTVLAGALGFLASIPLVARTLFPRLTARARNRFGRIVAPTSRTRLVLEREMGCTPGPTNGSLGFTLDELVASAERLLRDLGLTGNFARLVFTVGHGSSSMNNPHRSAYDCGACGGSPGAPNGRGAAQVLNDPRVRRRLEQSGIAIPDSTWFVGGFHNTCNDSVTLFDLDRVPDTHRAEFNRACSEIEQALERNAHERCRRFMSAPLDLTPAEARRHVEERSEDLAQTRPELGHATNAVTHVGRRGRTRGLFLDRRAFLTAYDPTQDDENGTILARTMAAIFPVCGGINLEYYFSHTDSPGYGCGTKLPHNITALLGVMDGAASDLRTGLPWQMVEIHEPVRLLIVCETTPEIMHKVLNGNPMGKAMTQNGWVQLAVQSPNSNDIRLYENGDFRPYRPLESRLPTAASSADWYRHCRNHLEFAEISSA